jgi:putative nucleotidyltransferase with HDIG domain
MAGDLNDDERFLAAALITPLIVGNSSYSADLTTAAGERAAAAVRSSGSTSSRARSSRAGRPIGDAELEALEALGLNEARRTWQPSPAGSCSQPRRGLLLAWLWRFRRAVAPQQRPGPHRPPVLGATVALKVAAGRSILTYFLPTAAVGMLLTILLDATIATFVMALIALIAGAVNGSLARDRCVRVPWRHGRHRDRPARRQAAGVRPGRIAVALVNALVVSVFSLLGERDIRGVLELWFASAAPGRVGGCRRGSFAVLARCSGSSRCSSCSSWRTRHSRCCGRLLVETPGTYHHSLMVGNLAERAAEAIGADPLLTRVAAYYHDVGKLANPLAFIENQAGGENVHDQLDPETSAQVLKQHVADGIRHRLQGAPAEAVDRVHPAAPRDRDHVLLLRAGEGPRRGTVRRHRDRRRPEGGCGR